MTPFDEFLRQRIEAGGFTTEDALASFLPLARQVADTHAEGQVAPLDGINALHVEDVRIWFEQSRRAAPLQNRPRLLQLEQAAAGTLEVVEEERLTSEVTDGSLTVENLRISQRDAEVTRPVYLPGYVCWEHQIEHHDPVTDVYSLGLILASLCCGLNLNEPADLDAFVSNRRNLFALNASLHPVLAKCILRMTELDRHRRPQDLSSLLKVLEHYREQEVDLDLDLARSPDFAKQDRKSKQQVVLTRLQQRLFEISRRNRLLHFRQTMQTVNLTQASVPLAFDVRSLRPDQILTWNDALHAAVAGGKPLPLNRHLNFREAVYLPSVLDRIRVEAERDQHEYGFAQLRLVACFLRWSNFKESPPERFESPFVLIPVNLVKKKGVRDTYWLEPLDTQAEINPVVRHLFHQLYAIDLPETVDLTQTSLVELHTILAAKIAASEPAIHLDLVDRPRIDVIHEKARRRLDQYCRNVRLSGRGVRTFLDIDYSYDPANYHPLGLKLFTNLIRPARTHLQAIIDSRPIPRNYAVAPDPPTAVEHEQTLYRLREGGESSESNPFSWEFDLCSVTLGNFRYRKMSLVRDYAALLQNSPQNAAFDATFSLAARPVDAGAPASPPLQERCPIVPSDPTQTAAIAQGGSGLSYIIQGPPGTGKSQTITNLIADYVARGKRVLFVCEKRAAIDVVYHRLCQRQFDPLCCLIHDSQGDKKEFIQDLKRTYEGFIDKAAPVANREEKQRNNVLQSLVKELEPLAQFDLVMRATHATSGVPLRQLLHRAIELAPAPDGTGRGPDTAPPAGSGPASRRKQPGRSQHEWTPAEAERVPRYAAWHACRDRLAAFHEALLVVQPDGVLARHPLRLLATAVKDQNRPIEFVEGCVQAARRLLDDVLATLSKVKLPPELWNTPARALALARAARRAEFLASSGLMGLLDKKSVTTRDFRKKLRRVSNLKKIRDEKAHAARLWVHRLPLDETVAALSQAQALEQKLLGFLTPAWWRMRKLMTRSCDVRTYQLPPTWVQALQWLHDDYQAASALQQAEQEVCRVCRIEESLDDFMLHVEAFRDSLREQPAAVSTAIKVLQEANDADAQILALSAALDPLEQLQRQLDLFLAAGAAGVDKTGADQASATAGPNGPGTEIAFDELQRVLSGMLEHLEEIPDFVPILRDLQLLPRVIADALRTFPWTLPQLEASCARRSLDEIARENRGWSQFNGSQQARQVGQLERLSRELLEANARMICERVRERFIKHVGIASLPAAALTPEQKEFKKQYSRGRRELEHEFSKTMRYKPIRDLFTGDSGLVVQDLKPVWLMSPLSVSDTLPLDASHFDVVIFDEASQITLEEAIPSLFRAAQAIVVGDEMQLPPTNFFSSRQADDDDDPLTFEEQGELVQLDLQSNSLLNHAARNLPSRMLGWHYRSRSETLISFSNWAFYQGRLLTVPDERLAPAGRAELTATSAGDAVANVDGMLATAVSFHFMQHGLYDKRRNAAEAAYIAALVRELLRQKSRPSVGIVAFSEAQQEEIESALDELAEQDSNFRAELEQEFAREADGQFAGLLVKNLENIQGDERDIIILSVCYAKAPDGRMRMNFGPINQSGGEKRLNVAFSRARQHMALVASIHAREITNDYNDGARCLKNYLEYAAACSQGDMATVQRVLRSLSLDRDARGSDGRPSDAVLTQISQALTALGYLVDADIGQSHFRCNLAVRRATDSEYRLGILVDTDEHYRQLDILDRDLMKPGLLRTFGWRVSTVLTKDWWENPQEVLERIVRALESADAHRSSGTHDL